MAKKLKYPIGIETFSDIIEGGYVYVDKTAYMKTAAMLSHTATPARRSSGLPQTIPTASTTSKAGLSKEIDRLRPCVNHREDFCVV